MSEDAPRTSKLGRCCCLLLLVMVLGVAGLVGYGYYALSSMRQGEPLPFEPLDRSTLDESILAAKFKLNELPGRLTGQDVEVELDQTELNTLLFANSTQTEDEKARVLLEQDSLRVEVSQRLEDGGYLNLRAHVALRLEAGSPPQLQLRGGSIGGFELGPLTRPVFQELLQRGLVEIAKREERVAKALSFQVRAGKAVLRYPPDAGK